MSALRRAFAEAARDLIGTPFRLRGRDPASGVDCIGLVVCALEAIGREAPVLPYYELRQLTPGRLLSLLPATGFMQADGPLQSGDLVLSRPSPGQFHLAIVDSPDLLIHAHAGIGRVVLTPATGFAPFTGHWRLH